jgi:CubicO group peptidase (beta-lactamase class C family)
MGMVTIAAMLAAASGGTEDKQTRRLPRCTPAEAGVPTEAVLAFLDAVEGKVGGLHGFMLVRHGKVAAEGWWRPYGARYPHMLFSLSKSFTSTGVGLAIAEGKLALDAPVLSFFPEDAPASPDANLKAMQVRHLLTMTSGHATDTLDRTVRSTEGNWVRTFLSLPVEHKPGTNFVYNSGATYMLSAIVQKVTGMTLLQYLKPRLFDPLGIRGMTWQTCPRGINTGGWGLSIKTEDIARFGQLYLQKGVWQGRQLVPQAWIAEATSKQVDNGTDPNSDWAQGYGYQFWRCRHNCYRGDGAFGQYCIVMPDQDAVVAITSGVSDMQAVLNAVWDHLLPAMEPGAQPSPVASQNSATDARLRTRVARLEVPRSPGGPDSPAAKRLHGKRYVLDANEAGLAAVTLTFTPARGTLTVEDAQGTHHVEFAIRDWLRGKTTLESQPSSPVAACAAWTEPEVLTVKICYYQTPFIRTFRLAFAGDEVTVHSSVNVSFGPTELPPIKGRLSAGRTP